MKKEKFVDLAAELVEEFFPKGKCQERGAAMVLVAMLAVRLKEEGLISK